MSTFLGVSRNLALYRLRPGDKSFWCVYGGTQRSEIGDLLLLYFPVGVSATRNGIAQVYRIISSPRVGMDIECTSRGMAQVETELLINLEHRITMKDLKADTTVRTWGAVGRNMQGVTFSMSNDVWIALRAIILARNPEAREIFGDTSKSL